MLNIVIFAVVVSIIVALVAAIVSEKKCVPIDGFGYIVRFPEIGAHEKVNMQFVDKLKSMDARVSKNLLSKLVNEAAGQKIDETFVGMDFDPEEFNRHAAGVIIDNAVPNNNPDVGTIVANHIKLYSMITKEIELEEAGKRIDEKFYMVTGLKKPVDLPLDFDLPILMEGEVYMKEVPEF